MTDLEAKKMCWGCREQIALRGERVSVGIVVVQGIEGEEDGLYPYHTECSLRSALGGIGHLRDHAFWCLQMHDPDAGLSYRDSALLVDQWVEEHGLDAAVTAGLDNGFGAEHEN